MPATLRSGIPDWQYTCDLIRGRTGVQQPAHGQLHVGHSRDAVPAQAQLAEPVVLGVGEGDLQLVAFGHVEQLGRAAGVQLQDQGQDVEAAGLATCTAGLSAALDMPMLHSRELAGVPWASVQSWYLCAEGLNETALGQRAGPGRRNAAGGEFYQLQCAAWKAPGDFLGSHSVLDLRRALGEVVHCR